VFVFLGALVILQLLLLASMLLFMFVRRAAKGDGFPGLVERFVQRLSRLKLVDRFLGRQLPTVLTHVGELRSRQVLYARVERWLLFTLVQRFAVAFNLAALATVFSTVAFSDLAFSWSTTLDVSAPKVKSWLSAMATPWSLMAPHAVPSIETIEQSQWVRLHGEGFVGGRGLKDAVAWARDWWPFLMMALTFYGLLPRLLAWAFGARAWRKELSVLSFDHAPFHRLWERLLPKTAVWERPDPASVGQVPAMRPPKRKASGKGASATPPDTRPRALVWGNLASREGALREVLALRSRTEIAASYKVGGSSPLDDEHALKALRSDAPRRVLLAFEVGMQPTKEVLHFLRRVRDAVGARIPVEVLLIREVSGQWIGADADEWGQWDRVLAAEGDPHLLLGQWRGQE
jgi:hypothetical protein